MLKFSPAKGNAKLIQLGKALGIKTSEVFTFSLLSGWTCPFAKDCLSKVYLKPDGTKL